MNVICFNANKSNDLKYDYYNTKWKENDPVGTMTFNLYISNSNTCNCNYLINKQDGYEDYLIKIRSLYLS